MNKVLLVGRLATEPNVFTTSSGVKYVRFTLAVQRTYSADDQADFVPVVAWRHQAEFIEKYFSKGARVSVDGRFTSSTYEKDGQKIYSYEVTAENVQTLETKSEADNRTQRTSEIKITKPTAKPAEPVTFEEGNKSKEEDIPWDLDI